ncbi:ATP-binding protein [Streptomyces flavofungini]|uniref:ATP-binding protein n=1 Tax=Streptomyces flavofungini TaxID=68200 RepID=UPI0025B1E605|nr:ATP-binding protein [Streptomyces flavofungini]WJV44235.1 ATP-binding protein [Streptomyces flavofungini]
MSDASLRAVGWAQSFPVSRGVRAGREWARAHVESLGWASTDPDAVDSVVLAVSELVTNAHHHARTSAQVVLTWDGRALHLTVHDSGPGAPAPRSADDTSVSGRGLAIVDALADTWSIHPTADGKTITACFKGPGAAHCSRREH